jgi:hypothetical protein
MSTNDSVGFWSYTHRDNALEGGRITRLATAIQNEFELLTGDSLNLFVDHEKIEWGNEWQDVIDSTLLKTAFFIPLITPLYMRSEQCRREFIEFVGKATRANARELVLPILYAETPTIADADTQDEVARLVRQIRWEDWRSLRLAPESSPEYRTAVNKLATRLVQIAAQVAERPPEEMAEDIDSDAPGVLDQVAMAEENISRWGDILTALGEDIVSLGQTVEAATEKLAANDRRRGGARGRLVVINEFAKEVGEIADRVLNSGSEFSRNALESDPGLRAVIRQSFEEVQTDQDREQVLEFYAQIQSLNSSANEATQHLRSLIESIDGVQSMARGLRTPMRQLRKGLTGVIDGVVVLNSWAKLVDEAQKN